MRKEQFFITILLMNYGLKQINNSHKKGVFKKNTTFVCGFHHKKVLWAYIFFVHNIVE